MGRAPCCDKANVKRGPWSPEEDAKLKEYMEKHGTGGNWIALPQKAGLNRCGKSCRLRWLNYLRPNIKHGEFSELEDSIICTLFTNIGSRWSVIAAQLPGRTDNDIKNYWNTKLKKKLMEKAITGGNYYANPNKGSPFIDGTSSPPSMAPEQQHNLWIPTQQVPFNSSSSSSLPATTLQPCNPYLQEAASCSPLDLYSSLFDHKQAPDRNLQGFSSSPYYENDAIIGGNTIPLYYNYSTVAVPGAAEDLGFMYNPTTPYIIDQSWLDQ
ncbi:hypothetical protein SAY87_007443 [Trapa incisa]|uniref:Uncharacterized protein n=1 Tax=Trapa incisa TaxID=236973 RepID=A0AAN7KKI6_9MYRT|nr:hypothetical protein SAY87_007443 [Trapa incisa]